MAKRKLGIVQGRIPLVILMRADIANGLATRAISDSRTQGACLDRFIETYLSTHDLAPLPEGAKLQRQMVGGGETKPRRYSLEPKTLRLLQEAETMGYSQSYIVEEAVKEGLSSPVEESA